MRWINLAVGVLSMVGIATCSASRSAACSVFCVVRDNNVWFCNNEDFNKPGYIWFVPAAKGRHGRVNLGFSDGFCQGSLNDKGLAFDAMALDKVAWKADPAKKSPKNLIEKIMDECETVREALAYFETFNCHHLEAGQFLFADAGGDAAVVAWLPETGLSVTRTTADHLIATNTRLGASGYRCQRFVRADQLLGQSKHADVAGLATVLNAVHQRGPGGFTSYSNIFDLKHRKIVLYNLANYHEAVVLHLSDELDKGATRPRPLADLFESSPTLEQIRAGEQRTTWDTRVAVSDMDLEKLVGTYSPEQVPGVKFHVKRGDGGVLLVDNPGQPLAVLIPESSTSFRIAPDRGQVTFLLSGNSKERATGMILHKARDLKAVRVE